MLSSFTHPSVLTAIVTVVGVIFTGVLGYLGASQSRNSKRLTRLEHDLRKSETTNSRLWMYTRALIDRIYRLGGVPPKPPAYIAHLFTDAPPPDDLGECDDE